MLPRLAIELMKSCVRLSAHPAYVPGRTVCLCLHTYFMYIG
jgi:hypothetical protein